MPGAAGAAADALDGGCGLEAALAVGDVTGGVVVPVVEGGALHADGTRISVSTRARVGSSTRPAYSPGCSMRMQRFLPAIAVAGTGVAAFIACSSFDDEPGPVPTDGAADAGLEAASTQDTGAVVCPPGFASCKGAGSTCETIIAGDDAKNCGSCGRDCNACAGCGGSRCTAGRCTPVNVSNKRATPTSIVADEKGGVWIDTGPDAGAVVAAPLDGGPPVVLAGDPDPKRLAIDADAIYWTSDPFAANAVRKLSRSCASPPCTIVSAPVTGHVFGIAVDDKHVYFTRGQINTNGGSLESLPKNDFDAGSTNLATGQSDPWEVVADEGAIYWTMVAGENEFLSIPRVSGAQRRSKPETCLTAQDCLPQRLVALQTFFGLAVSDAVYLADTYDPDGGTGGRIVKVPKVPVIDGGSFDVLAKDERDVYAIAVDDRHVYWVRATPGSRAGAIRRMPRSGICAPGVVCPEVLVAPGDTPSDVPMGIALTKDSIWFTNAGTGANNGTVWKIAK